MERTVRQAINRSRIKRFPYQKMLGESLTSWCYNQFIGGFSPPSCIKLLTYEMKKFFALYGDHLTTLTLTKGIDNMKISVNARYTEFKRK